jgi:N-carbamoyl-L-amino-acid hydrolase
VGTGSQIDGIPNAGKYDGVVGVLGGLEAIRALQRSGFQPKHSVELLIFATEEPTRFGIGCLGSRLLSGTLSADAAAKLKDGSGESVDEVRRKAGFSGALQDLILPIGYYKAFVELHIEQGPLLERAKSALGMVMSRAAPANYQIVIESTGAQAEGEVRTNGAAARGESERRGGHGCDRGRLRSVSGRGEQHSEPCENDAGHPGYGSGAARKRDERN